jgi:two-component system, OmpR family, phosphate regulon sensor histidine kinase PhoR
VKSRVIIIITALFGLMLIGVVIIQYGWISRIDDLNRKAFNDAVYKTLGSVVKQVQEKENFVFINRELETDTLLRETKKLLQTHHGPIVHKTEVSNNVYVSVNSENGKETETVVRIEKSNNGHKTTHGRVIIGSAAETIAVPPVPPTPPVATVMEVPPLAEENRKESVGVIIEKMMGLKNPDSVSIKPAEIERIIATELKQNNLPEKFTFALLSKDPKKSYVKLEGKQSGGTSFKINLYPNDLFGREVTLVLFLSQQDVITGFKEKILPQALSLFFTAALLILFIYSIRMLLLHKKMLAQKNDFINHMSHEFKTPLAGISLGADMLIDNPEKLTGEQIHRVATIIKKQSARLDKEVTGVLLSAQLDENINNNRAPFNLVETLKAQIDLFSLQLENKGAKITTSFSEPVIALNGDESLWQKVFSNLLDNSLKFSKENPEINVSVLKTNNIAKIEFSDNGIGIAEKDLPHIFEKFYRSNYYKQSNIQGFGLGLNFVKKVVDAHKGTIKAESELGKGTKIIIEINA